ncbi:MAG: bifunctional DNA-formamidopyrimidine glycosylase/DNA-(apurinic or apyrimidinic site) lyase [Planctomycetota bacterium]|nr:bifunctional DNA-formamidopyrimidine glycosylase/DNA-(apurinic or apyrimidinic site) lyase [Planctomycetota bacterium]
MPELPEVETMRRGILAIEGATITVAEKVRCLRKPITVTPNISTIRRRLVGKKVKQVGRIGKRVVIQMENDDRLLFEPRMTGLVLVADPPSQEHLRFRLEFSHGEKEVLYWDRRGLGMIYLLNDQQYQDRFSLENLGPDALDVTGPLLKKIFGKSRRPVKVALLDQKKVAGIGNLYASEILYVAAIHPAKRCDRITLKQWELIAETTVNILQTAIAHEGSTLSDGTYRNALNDPGGYQNMHRVYDKEDKPCPICMDTPITRIVQAQRSTFFCKVCQKRS